MDSLWRTCLHSEEFQSLRVPHPLKVHSNTYYYFEFFSRSFVKGNQLWTKFFSIYTYWVEWEMRNLGGQPWLSMQHKCTQCQCDPWIEKQEINCNVLIWTSLPIGCSIKCQKTILIETDIVTQIYDSRNDEGLTSLQFRMQLKALTPLCSVSLMFPASIFSHSSSQHTLASALGTMAASRENVVYNSVQVLNIVFWEHWKIPIILNSFKRCKMCSIQTITGLDPLPITLNGEVVALNLYEEVKEYKK